MKRVVLIIIFILFFALTASAEMVEGNGYRVDYVIGSGGGTNFVVGQPVIGELKGTQDNAEIGALYTWLNLTNGGTYVYIGPGGIQNIITLGPKTGTGIGTTPAGTPGTTPGTPPAGSIVKIDPPKISDVYIGNRLYFKDLVSKGDKFYTSKSTAIKATVKAKDGINTKKLSIKVTDSQGLTTYYTLSDANISSKLTKGATITQCNISYNIKNLGVGENSVEIKAANAGGEVKENLKLTVVSGMSVIGDVVVFPSPFSIPNDKTAYIQYTLSDATSVTIYVTSVGGKIVRKVTYPANTEGGNAGRNKVTWDGMSDTGELAGNGIYVGTVVSGGRILKRFKFTIKN